MKTRINKKNKGQVFTPSFIVDHMLSMVGYKFGADILDKHIIDNSCGDGAFLCRVVDIYCSTALKFGRSLNEIKLGLEQYIHGIEIDPEVYKTCIYNINAIAARYNLESVAWNVICGDTMQIKFYDGHMDYVVGNPPYIRVHNLKENYASVKRYSFATSGMTDLYLVFFEIGMQMLRDGGQLCYITPMSWLTSLAGLSLRLYIKTYHCLYEFVDLGHFQAFNATVYTGISLFIKGIPALHVEYSFFDSASKSFQTVDALSYDDIFIENKLYFSIKENLSELRNIKLFPGGRYAVVKNGFATLADKVFFGELPFDNFTIDVLKASTGKWTRGLFPYHEDGTPIDWNLLAAQNDIVNFLNDRSVDLLKGRNKDTTPDWYLYGRTQALKDVQFDKIAVNTIIRDKNSIKLTFVEGGKGVYSGLYILTNVDYDIIRSIIVSDDFVKYVSVLKNYKRGGYYTFSSRDLEQYINYKLK